MTNSPEFATGPVQTENSKNKLFLIIERYRHVIPFGGLNYVKACARQPQRKILISLFLSGFKSWLLQIEVHQISYFSKYVSTMACLARIVSDKRARQIALVGCVNIITVRDE